VALGYEVVDLTLVLVQEGLDVLLVYERGALRARHDQVEVDEEADPRVERDPAENKVEDILNGGEDGEHDEVDQPGRKQRWVGCVEGLVGREYGEQNGCGDAVVVLASCAVLWSLCRCG
jgi:hypothetical protein